MFLEDKLARITYVSVWMGQGRTQYTYECSHHPLSPYHGYLNVQSISKEHLDITDRSAIPTTALLFERRNPTSDAGLTAFEYIRLAQPEANGYGDIVLEDMADMGYAKIHDTFDLILLLYYFEHNEDSNRELAQTVRMLDGMKFTRQDNQSIS